MADESGEEAGRAGIQALDSALVVLRAIAAMPGAVSLSEIARQADMPTSKVHRYLASFAKAGLVRQTQKAGLYDLSKGAVELGLAAIARMDLVNEAASHIEELVLQTGAAGLVAVWGPQGPTVVRLQRSGSFVITSLGLGTTLPLLNSASGRIFLAYAPPAVIAAHLDQEIARARELGLRWPDLDPSRPGDLERLVKRIRRAGFSGVDGRFVPGLNAVSAAVLNWQGEPEAAITLYSGDPSILAARSRAVTRLLEVCERISVAGRAAGTLAARSG